MPNHHKSIVFDSFKGLNNRDSPESTPPNYLKKSLNINVDKKGISKRKGYTKVLDGNFTSLWASENGRGCYGVMNNDLYQIHSSYSTTLIDSDVGPSKISFEEVDDFIYYNSNDTSGVISNGLRRSWGIERNWSAPTLSITGGSLFSGIYQFTYTWIYDDGRESGCSRASVLFVPDSAGVLVQIGSAPSGVVGARVYCSAINGSDLYYHGEAGVNSSYLITSVDGAVDPLRFFNIDRPPNGHIIKYYRGRMYIASGNILWYSEPFQYEQFRLDSNYIEFPERIREVMPVEDGIWIGSDRLYYLSGDNPDVFKRTTKEHVKIVEGTGSRMSGSYLHLDNTPIGYKWLVTSDLGVWVLFNQGLCINLTAENVALKHAEEGTSVFLQAEGMNQYLSILKTNERPNNSSFGDLVETQIIRNGVVIN
jgi:hypothetical protein